MVPESQKDDMNATLRFLAITHAASLARGDVLRDLWILCETGDKISTGTVWRHLERIEEELKKSALMMRALIDALPKSGRKES